jgi:hypothetical protein
MTTDIRKTFSPAQINQSELLKIISQLWNLVISLFLKKKSFSSGAQLFFVEVVILKTKFQTTINHTFSKHIQISYRLQFVGAGGYNTI